MDAELREQIIRSLQRDFLSRFGVKLANVPVYCEGQEFDPDQLAEYVEFFVSGPTWQPSNLSAQSGEVTLDAACFCREGADAHRLDQIAGAAEAVLHRQNAALRTYPDAEPLELGVIRLGDASSVAAPLTKGHAHGGAGSTLPLRQITVTVSGKIEIIS